MTEREELLLVALELGAIAETLEGVPIESADLAYVRERVDFLRKTVGEMTSRADSDTDLGPQTSYR